MRTDDKIDDIKRYLAELGHIVPQNFSRTSRALFIPDAFIGIRPCSLLWLTGYA